MSEHREEQRKINHQQDLIHKVLAGISAAFVISVCGIIWSMYNDVSKLNYFRDGHENKVQALVDADQSNRDTIQDLNDKLSEHDKAQYKEKRLTDEQFSSIQAQLGRLNSTIRGVRAEFKSARNASNK